jgi:hypothetical protein
MYEDGLHLSRIISLVLSMTYLVDEPVRHVRRVNSSHPRIKIDSPIVIIIWKEGSHGPNEKFLLKRRFPLVPRMFSVTRTLLLFIFRPVPPALVL